MALLDNAKAQVQEEKAKAQVHEAPAASAETAPKKKHNNSEYQKRQREKSLAAAQLIAGILTDDQKKATGTGDFATVQDAIDFLCRVKKPGTGNGPAGQTPIFEKLFGTEPKVGTVVTAYDMLKKTGKGFGDMTKLIKKWSEDANNPRIVEFNEEKLEYKLVKIGK